MDERPVQRDSAEHDADAPLARDDSNWFARQLGQEWQAEEPGIYRYVGSNEPRSDVVRSTGELCDALAPRGRHRPEYDADEHPSKQWEEQGRGR
jgi:hypothetical protein